eukprot:CAMPEP_0181248190 /NCGR_PEP_ID=MMETSP1096-20121128/45031_1 /TAXON_ID=156174 ORGANISM="Chrysochromulina ericina, Strain CCMP281" /NCGR_SAMPLE_ID=MMETSP1096 /ASSEMBLY_ACC=CAM_ASM_000453 /LENGTH=101 /DNA_ID=CAMNT_0023345329 /DNA_START=265 /DNA_END=571 /DNA_ORIENTATION=-
MGKGPNAGDAFGTLRHARPLMCGWQSVAIGGNQWQSVAISGGDRNSALRAILDADSSREGARKSNGKAVRAWDGSDGKEGRDERDGREVREGKGGEGTGGT